MSKESWDIIKGVTPTSFCDWPGRITTVVYTGGCNFRCPTCHNWRIAFRPETERSQYGSIEDFINDDTLSSGFRYIEGVIISGGEPTIHTGLSGIIKQIKTYTSLPVGLHTNGSRPQHLQILLNSSLVDYIAVDVKGPWDKYPELTGNKISASEAEKSFEWIFLMARDNPDIFRFRTTKVPELSDSDLEVTLRQIPGILQGSHVFQEYRPVEEVAASKN